MAIVVIGIKRLGFDIYLLKCFGSMFSQAKEFEVVK